MKLQAFTFIPMVPRASQSPNHCLSRSCPRTLRITHQSPPRTTRRSSFSLPAERRSCTDLDDSHSLEDGNGQGCAEGWCRRSMLVLQRDRRVSVSREQKSSASYPSRYVPRSGRGGRRGGHLSPREDLGSSGIPGSSRDCGGTGGRLR